MSVDLTLALRFPKECTEGVQRGDQYEPCDKTAVAVRIDPEHGTYPTCAQHSRAPMVSLAEILAEVREQAALKLEGARMIHAAHAVRGES